MPNHNTFIINEHSIIDKLIDYSIIIKSDNLAQIVSLDPKNIILLWSYYLSKLSSDKTMKNSVLSILGQ